MRAVWKISNAVSDSETVRFAAPPCAPALIRPQVNFFPHSKPVATWHLLVPPPALQRHSRLISSHFQEQGLWCGVISTPRRRSDRRSFSQSYGRPHSDLISLVLLPGQCSSRHSCTGLPRIHGVFITVWKRGLRRGFFSFLLHRQAHLLDLHFFLKLDISHSALCHCFFLRLCSSVDVFKENWIIFWVFFCPQPVVWLQFIGLSICFTETHSVTLEVVISWS